MEVGELVAGAGKGLLGVGDGVVDVGLGAWISRGSAFQIGDGSSEALGPDCLLEDGELVEAQGDGACVGVD